MSYKNKGPFHSAVQRILEQQKKDPERQNRDFPRHILSCRSINKVRNSKTSVEITGRLHGFESKPVFPLIYNTPYVCLRRKTPFSL